MISKFGPTLVGVRPVLLLVVNGGVHDERGARVELFEQIRRARRDDPGVSIRELARRFETHRRTVRDALVSPVPPVRKASAPKCGAGFGSVETNH